MVGHDDVIYDYAYVMMSVVQEWVVIQMAEQSAQAVQNVHDDVIYDDAYARILAVQ